MSFSSPSLSGDASSLPLTLGVATWLSSSVVERQRRGKRTAAHPRPRLHVPRFDGGSSAVFTLCDWLNQQMQTLHTEGWLRDLNNLRICIRRGSETKSSPSQGTTRDDYVWSPGHLWCCDESTHLAQQKWDTRADPNPTHSWSQPRWPTAWDRAGSAGPQVQGRRQEGGVTESFWILGWFVQQYWNNSCLKCLECGFQSQRGLNTNTYSEV